MSQHYRLWGSRSPAGELKIAHSLTRHFALCLFEDIIRNVPGPVDVRSV
jgi:hypothetical protein